MVATFEGMGDMYVKWDYEGSDYNGWINPKTIREEVKAAPNIGLIMPTGFNTKERYFLPDVQVNVRGVGRWFSEAYKAKTYIDSIINPEPDSDLAFFYPKLTEFAAKQGYKDNLEIKGFGVGFMPEDALAAIEFLGNDYVNFLISKRLSEMSKREAAIYNVSPEIVIFRTNGHELVHKIQGYKKRAVEAELENEIFMKDFLDYLIKYVYGAVTFNDKKRTEIARKLREMKRITEDRINNIYRLYSKYEKSSANVQENSEKSQLEAIVSDLIQKAKNEGKTSYKEIKDYVTKKLEERSEGYKGKGDNKEEQKGKEPKKSSK
ncbi:MAG: hypothetical protein KAK00_00130, partial [Nanoarchaeota archaeon]|nr:hypothetical protein [Nanoarchaeota archaeon]